MIYSSPAASASDLWDDTLWEGFLRAGESGFQLMPWGNIIFKDMLSSVEILTQRPAGGWECHLNAVSDNTAFEGRLFLLFHVRTEQGSTAQRHWVSNTISGEYYIQHYLSKQRCKLGVSSTSVSHVSSYREPSYVSLPCIALSSPFGLSFSGSQTDVFMPKYPKNWNSDLDRAC